MTRQAIVGYDRMNYEPGKVVFIQDETEVGIDPTIQVTAAGSWEFVGGIDVDFITSLYGFQALLMISVELTVRERQAPLVMVISPTTIGWIYSHKDLFDDLFEE